MIHPAGFGSAPAFHADGTDSTPVGDRHRAALLRRQQPGRDHGRRAGRGRARTSRARRSACRRCATRSCCRARSTTTSSRCSLNAAYTDELSRPLLLSLIQMLWDRGEPNGYAHRMTTNPLPDTPAHTVLLGRRGRRPPGQQLDDRRRGADDRRLGARSGRRPRPLARHRRALERPADRLATRSAGSVVFYTDFGPVRPDPSNPSETIGTPPAPLRNVPNRVGEDPHGAPRGIPNGLAEVSNFLQDGRRRAQPLRAEALLRRRLDGALS